MTFKNYVFCLVCVLVLSVMCIKTTQAYRYPVNVPKRITGTIAENRCNTDYSGNCIDPLRDHFHKCVDFSGDEGDKVIAVEDGFVNLDVINFGLEDNIINIGHFRYIHIRLLDELKKFNLRNLGIIIGSAFARVGDKRHLHFEEALEPFPDANQHTEIPRLDPLRTSRQAPEGVMDQIKNDIIECEDYDQSLGEAETKGFKGLNDPCPKIDNKKPEIADMGLMQMTMIRRIRTRSPFAELTETRLSRGEKSTRGRRSGILGLMREVVVTLFPTAIPKDFTLGFIRPRQHSGPIHHFWDETSLIELIRRLHHFLIRDLRFMNTIPRPDGIQYSRLFK